MFHFGSFALGWLCGGIVATLVIIILDGLNPKID